jgi:hypothetical protein
MKRHRAPEWTDHDVSDPGITLVQLMLFSLPVLATGITVAVMMIRRSHRRRA